ncbi:MAG: hypothetical protein NTX44_04065 [Ignavibacteriales bacterium]|nr:hypothetical protein [Ignavibacteriales bacterium]
MKNLIIFLIAIGLVLPFFSANAQSKRKKANSENIGDRIGREADDVGNEIDKIGNNIDKLVNNMVNRGISPFNDEQMIEDDTLESTSHISPNITESEIDSNSQTFSGDKVIEQAETIHNNVVVKGGDLTIYGTVDGDVLVVGGDLQMKRTGKITGGARVINGSIRKEDGAIIEGFEDFTSKEQPSFRPSRRNFSRTVRTFDVPWSDEQTNLDNFIFRYNRVEGVFLGLGSEKKYNWDGERNWNMYGSVGWGFRSHTWRGNLGLVRQFALLTNEGNGIIELGAEGYSFTDTKDKWVISLHENTAAALFIHEDFRDYFQRNGYTVHAAYYSKHDYLKNELKFAYLVDTYDSLTNKVDWALFGGGKKFRMNPLIVPGKMRSMIVSGGVSTISKTSYGSEGWSLNASAEFAKKNWGSEFEFDQYILDLRRYQPLGKYDNFNIRLRAGSLVGDILEQKAFDLGGLGTMNAFPFKSETGNRMLLINAEFIVNGSFLEDVDFWPMWIFHNVNIMLLSDAGFTRQALPTASVFEGVETVKFNDFKHDVGVAFTNRSGSFRIGVVWRTDHPAPAQFILRFNRPF